MAGPGQALAGVVAGFFRRARGLCGGWVFTFVQVGRGSA